MQKGTYQIVINYSYSNRNFHIDNKFQINSFFFKKSQMQWFLLGRVSVYGTQYEVGKPALSSRGRFQWVYSYHNIVARRFQCTLAAAWSAVLAGKRRTARRARHGHPPPPSHLLGHFLASEPLEPAWNLSSRARPYSLVCISVFKPTGYPRRNWRLGS